MKTEVFGGWVVLREPDLVPERLRRPVFEKTSAGANFTADGNVSPEALAFFSEFNDLLVVAMVAEWSFENPISLDGVMDLPSKTYDDLRKLVAPFVSKLIPDFGVDVDPKVTIEPSSESVGS